MCHKSSSIFCPLWAPLEALKWATYVFLEFKYVKQILFLEEGKRFFRTRVYVILFCVCTIWCGWFENTFVFIVVLLVFFSKKWYGYLSDLNVFNYLISACDVETVKCWHENSWYDPGKNICKPVDPEHGPMYVDLSRCAKNGDCWDKTRYEGHGYRDRTHRLICQQELLGRRLFPTGTGVVNPNSHGNTHHACKDYVIGERKCSNSVWRIFHREISYIFQSSICREMRLDKLLIPPS